MFVKTQDRCLFIIRTKTEYKHIVLNQLFLSHFVSFFDYETKTITLYSSSNNIVIKENKVELYLLISNILLLLFQSIILICILK